MTIPQLLILASRLTNERVFYIAALPRGTQTIGNEIILNLTVDTPYAAYLEYGTKKLAARPYVEKVVQQHYDMLLAELNK